MINILKWPLTFICISINFFLCGHFESLFTIIFRCLFGLPNLCNEMKYEKCGAFRSFANIPKSIVIRLFHELALVHSSFCE